MKRCAWFLPLFASMVLILSACDDFAPADFGSETLQQATMDIEGEFAAKIVASVTVPNCGSSYPYYCWETPGCSPSQPEFCLRLCFTEDNCLPFDATNLVAGSYNFEWDDYWDDTDGQDHPYIEINDDWDNVYFKGPISGYALIEDLEVTYSSYFANTNPVNAKNYSFINGVFDPPKAFQPADTHYGFENHITAWREHSARMLLDEYLDTDSNPDTPTWFSLNNMPISVREMVKDIGQSGVEKHTGCDLVWGAGAVCGAICNATATPYLLQYTHDFDEDMPVDGFSNDTYMCIANDLRCYNYWGGNLYPYYTWSPYPDSGRTAILNVELEPDGDNVRELLSSNDIIEVAWETDTDSGFQSGKVPINPPGAQGEVIYTPKPGDQYYRVDRCVNGPNYMHSMSLLASPRYLSGGNGSVESMVFDAGEMGLARKYIDSYFFDDTFFCNNSAGCLIDPVDGPRCPYTAGNVEYRYLYVIGIAKNPEEWFVSIDGTDPWNRIGNDIYQYPIDDSIRAEVMDWDNPYLDDIKEFDYDGDGVVLPDFDADGKPDFFFRNSDDDWLVSYSSEDYTGWKLKGNSQSNPGEKILFGDFGTRRSRTADGKDDLMRYFRKEDNNVWIQLAYNEGVNSSFYTWLDRKNLGSSQTPDWWYSRTRLIDNDADGLADIFYKTTDSKWKIIRGVNLYDQTAWATVRNGTPNAISTYRFYDHDGDGRTDVFQIIINGATQERYWQICRANPANNTYIWPTGSGDCEDNSQYLWRTLKTTSDQYTIGDIRIGKFNGSSYWNVIRKDLIDPKPTYLMQPINNNNWNNGWSILYDFVPHKYLTALLYEDFDEDGKTDVFSYEKDIYQETLAP